MRRVLLAGVAMAAAAGGVWAETPAGAGKERTQIEQELYLPDQPTPRPAAPTHPGRADGPTSGGVTVMGVVGWVLWSAGGTLGVCPLVPPQAG